MKTKPAKAKSGEKRHVSGGEQDSAYSASLEFSKLKIDKPLVYNDYGKISTRKHVLEQDWGEERIEVLLRRNSK